ncbi:MAG: ferrous iron transport protein A [Candidatus Hodarchaeota archaeon]
MTTRLSELKVGQKARIHRIKNGRGLRQTLLDLGFIPGTEIELIRKAPLGDPYEIRLRGFEITLRKNDAADIEVEVIQFC